jgi:hypothetical protein
LEKSVSCADGDLLLDAVAGREVVDGFAAGERPLGHLP